MVLVAVLSQLLHLLKMVALVDMFLDIRPVE
jgi:uncharacterized protein YybS (DUF2232 family)